MIAFMYRIWILLLMFAYRCQTKHLFKMRHWDFSLLRNRFSHIYEAPIEILESSIGHIPKTFQRSLQRCQPSFQIRTLLLALFPEMMTVDILRLMQNRSHLQTLKR